MPDQAPNTHPHSTHPSDQQIYDEDEINLLDLFLVFLKYKWFIAVTVIITGIVAVVISLNMTNIYQSSATIAPQTPENPSKFSSLSGLGIIEGYLGIGGGGSNLNKLEVVLQSRELSQGIVDKYELKPLLFRANWDSKAEKWLTDEEPTEQDAVGKLRRMLSISTDKKKNVLFVKFNHRDPQFAKDMVDRYLTELSENLRKNTLEDANEKAGFLQEELSRTSDVLLKEKISALLANEIEKMTFARAQKYFNFEVIDPPIVPDADKRIKPRRSLICILAVIVAFFVAVFLAFFLEFLRNVKANADPEQLDRLHKYLGKKE